MEVVVGSRSIWGEQDS